MDTMHTYYANLFPVMYCSIEAACSAHPTADVFINFASFRRSVFYIL